MAKILLVDDEPSILALFRYTFEEAGHEVSVAANGREALDLIRENIPDFMVMDISMPVMSGTEFAEELKRLAADDPRYGSIPFVVMTGESFMESGIGDVFASLPGFVCFFPKMVPPEDVCEKAGQVLAGR